MGQVDGKIATVTGGASGIGAACAATLAREGAKVVVTDLDDTGGRDLVAARHVVKDRMRSDRRLGGKTSSQP